MERGGRHGREATWSRASNGSGKSDPRGEHGSFEQIGPAERISADPDVKVKVHLY
ncbi:hypothetical protein [Streptomyces tuirus]